MTSKEALDQLIDEIKYTHNDGKTLTDYDAKLVKVIQKDLEILELLHKRIKPDIFGRICYVPIVEERDGVVQDFEAEKIWRWLKNEI